MYTPKAFREDDIARLHQLMHDYSFATLITAQEGGLPLVSHLPFLLERERGPYGVLVSHMARANEQWHALLEDQEALVIFQGPHAYVSPSWYEPDPLSVPTWNYAVAHAYGRPRIIKDGEAVYRILQALVDKNEAGFAQPWELHPPDEYTYKRMQALVAFEIEITRLEGKYKLSQNRPMHDREHVAAALAVSSDPQISGVAALMKDRSE